MSSDGVEIEFRRTLKGEKSEISAKLERVLATDAHCVRRALLLNDSIFLLQRGAYGDMV